MIKSVNKTFKYIFLLLVVIALTGCSSEAKNEKKAADAIKLKLKAMEEVNFNMKPYKETLYDESAVSNKTEWGNLNTHDPGIFKDGDYYYVFSTDASRGNIADPGVQIRKSKDLINWEYSGTAFEELPKEAIEWTGATGLWAPDVIKIQDEYYLYYSASTFGSNKSFIGVAKSKSIEGPWEDLGEVIKTDTTDKVNAIDPNLVYDKSGRLWMSYGSFWDGIYIVEIDIDTGKPKDEGIGKKIAGRSADVRGAIEGPYIVYNEEFNKYYLFVSYDSLASDYSVRVGRSDSIDGPYVDSNGLELTDISAIPFEVGNKILGGYKFGDSQGWIAPGHNSVLKDNNNYYIVHHARGDESKDWFYMHVRKILWSDNGWPMVSPERYAGEEEQELPADVVLGKWDTIILQKYDIGQSNSNEITILKDGKLKDMEEGSWELNEDNTMILNLVNKEKSESYIFNCKLIPSWDWENNKNTVVFTGIDENGIAIWGKSILDK